MLTKFVAITTLLTTQNIVNFSLADRRALIFITLFNQMH